MVKPLVFPVFCFDCMDQHASAGLQEVADLQYLRHGTNMSAAVQVLCTILV